MPTTMNLADAGRFRANVNASSPNNTRVLSSTPGTPAKDTVAMDISTLLIKQFKGVIVTYDSADVTELFFTWDHKTGTKIPGREVIPTDIADLQTQVAKVMEMYEVDPVVTVTIAGDVVTVNHWGSATLKSVMFTQTDGTEDVAATSRTAIP